MKRIIFLVVTMLLCLCSYAQSFDFGVTGGLTVSDPKDVGSHVGYNVGVKGELLINEGFNDFFFSPELLLVHKGWKELVYYVEEDDKTHDWMWNLNYLEIPLLVGMRMCKDRNTQFVWEAGPYVAVGLWGDNKLEDDPNFGTSRIFSDNVCRRFDCGIKAYAGMEWGRLRCGVNLTHGFLDTLKDPYDVVGNRKMFTYGVQLTYMITK
ncbi:PorT family protein [Prevotella sp. PINT]|uniref:porin family protein n=1 Tax=Palleniella intestinalis TaxID=2736291 RepID=UPI0015550303|nr:porin family protein [Palleniella intestinalis]NPD82255.1 PorT family protein [Palleniella intestinalis]